MLLNVPFIPDDDYASFLAERSGALYSIHFSLYSEDVPDARYRFDRVEIDTLIAYLTALEAPKKYLLMNSRFHHPNLYADPKRVLARLETLLAAGVLDGIVYADAYYLQALSDGDKTIAAHLEAVPSVNLMIDDVDKAAAVMETIAMTEFKPPGKLALDRSLNRNIPALVRTASRCRELFPNLKLELLANEGCLYQCPFKLTHDAHISLVHMDMDPDTHSVNRSLGCIRQLSEDPRALFKSPFIRPEDTAQYDPHVDIVKLCGRTLGPAFLKRVITAYLDRRFSGNLLDLMDAMDWLADRWVVANQDLPEDFFETVTACDKHCRTCSYCSRLFEGYAAEKPPVVKDFRA